MRPFRQHQLLNRGNEVIVKIPVGKLKCPQFICRSSGRVRGGSKVVIEVHGIRRLARAAVVLISHGVALSRLLIRSILAIGYSTDLYACLDDSSVTEEIANIVVA